MKSSIRAIRANLKALQFTDPFGMNQIHYCSCGETEH